MYVEEGLYYPYKENKDADQLCGHRTTDLRLCLRICKKPVFLRRGSFLSRSSVKVQGAKQKQYIIIREYS